jgi:hypothetical protein
MIDEVGSLSAGAVQERLACLLACLEFVIAEQAWAKCPTSTGSRNGGCADVPMCRRLHHHVILSGVILAFTPASTSVALHPVDSTS